jgi:seryl-tRNA synthetase
LELVVQLKSRVTTLESKQGDYATKEELLKVTIEQKNTKVLIDGVAKEQSWLKKELEKLAAQLAKFDSPTRQEFELLKSRVDALENQLSNLKKQIDGILQKLKGLKASPGAGGNHHGAD